MSGVRRLFVGIAAGTLLVAAPVAYSADPSVHDVSIAAKSFMFAPQALAVHQGDRVRWTNNDDQLHMIVTAKPDSNGKELEIYHRLDPGTSFDHHFATVSAYYYYYCAIHFQMWGIISVNP